MRFFLLLLSSLAFLLTTGQDLVSLEERMSLSHDMLVKAESDDLKVQAANELAALFEEAFGNKESFTYPFSKISRVVKLLPDDEALRVFNWTVPLSDNTFRYHMYVLFPNGKFVRFSNVTELTHSDERKEISNENWYGSLYYEIKRVKVKGKSYYTLLGWDGNDQLTTKKVIDVLVTNGKSKASLGYPLFDHEGLLKHRRVFEFASDAQVNLKWLKSKKIIVFDHLEPTSPNLEGQYAFYGPSTSFDGYEWAGDHWKLNENVDMSRPKSNSSNAQFNFPERPDFTRQRDKTNPLNGK